jgi:hypothetical protein
VLLVFPSPSPGIEPGSRDAPRDAESAGNWFRF